jgi:glycogen debranching enzyme
MGEALNSFLYIDQGTHVRNSESIRRSHFFSGGCLGGPWSLVHILIKASIVGLLVWCFTFAPRAQAQLSFDTSSVAPERFIAAHGSKAVVMGYASSGLELWAYPLQLLSGYEIGFRSAGETSEVTGVALLRRVTYDPEAVIRTYVGPDFIVRERLFVPLDEQAIYVTYTVECRHSIEIIIHFRPVLDLMWPASLGGQNTHWDSAASAYVLAEATHKYQALIGSPGVVAHDEILNSAQPGTPGRQLAFTIRAGGEANRSVAVIVARNNPGTSPEARLGDLLTAETRLESQARAHYVKLLAHTLRIGTPDPAINQQLAWAQIALDQAWVCNEVLGCGLVAGYGPSRDARRPQYDWFFAGDGLVAVDALVNTGDFDQAKAELSFIAKYQDAHTGMIWHEISQSADPADWAIKYPYMFVHVDITFQYLIAVEHYVVGSGDTQWVQQNWQGVEAAYRYCASLLNQDDGLPRIPSTKEGGNEQDRMTDDLNLSTSWVATAAAFARLSRATGHAQLAEEAQQLSEKAERSVTHRYWDDQRNSWIDGYDGSGRPVFRRSGDGVDLARILDQRRSQSILDQIASSGFETDWGTRGVAASSPRFDPNSYASGSVSALATSDIASAFWVEHRPSTAFSIWKSLLPWGTLDSMGHMHEVLTGDFYHQQAESVPEQTWSSAGFLSSAVRGLLGLETEAQANHLNFSPHLPSAWDRMSVSNIKLPNGTVAMALARVRGGLDLQIENTGSPLELSFTPEIPLAARLSGATLDGKPLPVHKEEHQQDTHAALRFKVPSGKSDCFIRYEGGIAIGVKEPAPLVGESSRGIKLTSVAYDSKTLVLEADVRQDEDSSVITLRTDEKPLGAHGAKLVMMAQGEYELIVDQTLTRDAIYQHREITVDFAGKRDR